tara:strand:+ start:199 stop:498 length:300 start_codon:yes stop_codon:yes gene_type:complete
MKKLILFETILILFFVLAWSVSKAREDSRFCSNLKTELNSHIIEYNTQLDSLYKKDKDGFSNALVYGEDKISKKKEEILIRLHRRLDIYYDFCMKQVPH